MCASNQLASLARFCLRPALPSAPPVLNWSAEPLAAPAPVPSFGSLSQRAAARNVLTAPAPIASWILSERPKFSAVAPNDASFAAVTVGSQPPTIAGPTLPPRLLYSDHSSSHPRASRQRFNWPFALTLLALLVLATGIVFQLAVRARDWNPLSLLGAVFEEHPADRSIEVSGIRIVRNSGHRPQLRYIVVNHAASEAAKLEIRLAIRSSGGLTGAPLFSVSNTVAALGPNESKEIRTELDPSASAADIPDWQSLRTEVIVSRR